MGAITFSTTLTATNCPTCGVLHAYPDVIDREAQDNRGPGGRKVYCPNGHTWWYVGKSDAEKERERADRLAARLTHEQDQHEATRRQLTATKGAVTKAKKRAAAGVCGFCKRSFSNVRRHVESQHPKEVVVER